MNTTATAQFVPTQVGLNYAEVNVIHWASRVQVFQGSLGKFYTATPSTARSTGIRVLSSHTTFEKALEAAELLIPNAVRRIDRMHAQALKMNAAR